MTSATNQFASYHLEGKILKIDFHPDGKIDLKAAKKIMSDRYKFFGKDRYYILCIDHGLNSVNAEARNYFSSLENPDLLLAIAFVTPTLYSEFLARFFLYKYPILTIPVKLFKSEKKAITWLKQLEHPDV